MALNSDSDSGSKLIFLQFNGSTGKLIQKVNGEKKAYKSLSGKVTDVLVKQDEYDGQPLTKLLVRMSDETGARYQVELNASIPGAGEFMARLNNADIQSDVLIQGYVLEKGSEMKFKDGTVGIREHDYIGVSVRQGATFETLIPPNYGETGAERPKTPPLQKLDRKTNQMVEVRDEQGIKEDAIALSLSLGGAVADRIKGVTGDAQRGEDDIDPGEVAAAANRQRAA